MFQEAVIQLLFKLGSTKLDLGRRLCHTPNHGCVLLFQRAGSTLKFGFIDGIMIQTGLYSVRLCDACIVAIVMFITLS